MPTAKKDMLTIALVAALGASAPGLSLAAESGAADQTGTAGRKMLTDADMPPVESLKDGDNYSVFMSPGVSDSTRLQALRRLFHSAAFNRTDGLANYAHDYSSLAEGRARLVGLGEETAFSTMQ